MLKHIRTKEINNAKQAAILLEPKTLHYLSPFFQQATTAEQAAQMLGVNLNTLLYQIKRLIKADLLEITKDTPRQGRSIKHYKSTAEEYFIPFNATAFTSPEELLLEEYTPLYRRILRNFLEVGMQMLQLNSVSDFGLVISLGDQNKPIIRHAPNPKKALDINPLTASAPAILALWQELKLDYADAKTLQAELNTVFERYITKTGHTAYLINILLTPDVIQTPEIQKL